MVKVELEEREWQAVINVLSTGPWRDVHPLLMKIGEQVRMQTNTATVPGAEIESANDKRPNAGGVKHS